MAVLIATACTADMTALRRILEPVTGVHWASTCAEALRVLDSAPVSVILCDAELPDGDWQFILHTAQGRPVVVFSRFADDALWAEVLSWGAYDLLLLPFDTEEVRRVVAAAERRQRSASCLA